jgi:hypothetical protein
MHTASFASRGLLRAALYATVAAAAILPQADLAVAQAVTITTTPVAPYRYLPSLEAVPQVPQGQRARTAVVKPYRTLVDPLTFAAQKAQAKAMRFEPKGAIKLGAPRQAQSGLVVPKQTWAHNAVALAANSAPLGNGLPATAPTAIATFGIAQPWRRGDEEYF